MTEQGPLRLYFDYVDPASYLLDRWLRNRTGASLPEGLELRPFELRPPPQTLLATHDPEWSQAWARLAEGAERLELTLRRPWIVPWSRKAHELALFARESGCHEEIHGAIFRAYFEEGLDIGRVDVLVELGRRNGLDAMEVKAVLDVDRFRSDVEVVRSDALSAGVTKVPTFLAGGEVLPGYPEADGLDEILPSASNELHN